jgi:hypothetical protein
VTAFSSYQAYPGQAPTLLEPPPVLVAVLPPQPQARLGVFFRLLLAIPHFIVLCVIGLVAGVIAFLGWWGALFTGRLPQFAVNFLSGYLRWSTRVFGYVLLLTEAYPPFSLDDDPEYAVRIAIPAPQRLNRAAVFFRFILALPVAILASIIGYGGITLVALVAWLITVFTGRLPAPLHLAYAATLRFQTRYLGYYLMLTPAYPGGLYGDRQDAVTWADGLDTAQAPGYGMPGPSYGTPAPGYGAPASGFGAPAPGYGAPVDSPQGGYGPGYGGPGYGAPAGYETPGAYGVPNAYGVPGGYQPGPGSQSGMWLLPLTIAAKRLLTLFIVLGALLYIGGLVRDVMRTSSAVSTITGLVQLNSSYDTLAGKITTWQTATTNCGQNLTCITAQDAMLASAFSTFSGQLSSISVPSGATADKATLSSDTNLLVQDFTELSQATSADEYNSTLSSINLSQTLDKWSTDVTTLDNDD